jgi:hypothetical protein
MTNREILSQIRESNEFMQYDHMVTDRYLLSLANKYGLVLFRRDFNQRKFSNTSDLPINIFCLAMKEVPLAECIEYKSDTLISRSVNPIPRVEQGYYGYMMQVFDIEQGREVQSTTPKNYINVLQRRFKPRNLFYWIQNGYLYVNEPQLEVVRLNAMFVDYCINPAEVDQCVTRECEGCPDCFEPLEQPFKFPGYMVPDIINMVNQELGNTHHRYPTDNTDDLATNP